MALDAVHRLRPEHVAAIGDRAVSGSGKSAELCAKVWPLLCSGVDGEVWMDWPDASSWLMTWLPTSFHLGGNAGQAANTLSAVGAPSLLAITDRRPAQLATVGEHVRIAESDGAIVPAARVVPTSEPGRAANHILEFFAGTPLPVELRKPPLVIPRSGRVILRFVLDGPSYDEYFVAAAKQVAPHAGAALVSGLNKVPPSDVERAYAWCRQRAVEWRAAGVGVVHHELSSYARQERTVRELVPHVNSVGLSESELYSVLSFSDPAALAADMVEQYGLDRVVVHSDRWALVVSRADPELELHALAVACLLAAARAEHGVSVLPIRLPVAAALLTSGLPPPVRRAGMHSVCLPTLWQPAPRGTVGLGDTFMAGNLLALGSNCPPLRV
ncbi:MAG: hypothetical protein DLM55_05385 [Acidimicrobiales bacterium]|nr:MAG: hypothetical protein DLM55_05385 [Acidimicrobiales bacterium]